MGLPSDPPRFSANSLRFNVPSDPSYQLIDFGDGKKLERIGGLLVERPCPGALSPASGSPLWSKSDVAFRNEKWHYQNSYKQSLRESPWVCQVDGLRLTLKTTPTGQVGIFPEHWAYWNWISERVAPYIANSQNDAPPELPAPRPRILHLFAYTGATSLALAKMGCHVTHVDASRPTVQWARENCHASELEAAPIRWLIEDAARFVQREVRRGNQYEGIILDPPSFGHGTQAERWQIKRDLMPLLDQCWQLLSEHRCFVLLCGHSADIRLREITKELQQSFGSKAVGKNSFAQAGIVDSFGRTLDCGFVSRYEW